MVEERDKQLQTRNNGNMQIQMLSLPHARRLCRFANLAGGVGLGKPTGNSHR